MKYYSTRDKNVSLSAAEAVKMGLSRDGGLLTPTRIPQIDRAFLERLIPMEYAQRAAKVMALYLTDYSDEELLTFGRNAYGPAQFDDPAAAPVRKVEDGLYCLELWHGPTSAFKDMALQMLPQLLSAALRKTGEKRTACILAATSGDTGKAAMAGFADVPQTCIQVYYPKDGVSPVQERQMVTQEGENVDVRAVIGNFDDAQAGVKRIFSDEAVRAELDKRGYFLSSANSINWGRILPQVVYYISAYCDLVRDGALTMGDKVNFCVPTGNFGDILAAYYAKRMGLPVNKLICASNSNNVPTDFLRTGVYDRNRPFHTTISPSMDILISSNLERLLFDLSGENDAEIRMYMDALGSAGRYQVSDNIKAKLDDAFWGGCCSEEETEEIIRRYYQAKTGLVDGSKKEDEVFKLELLMKQAHITPQDRKVVSAALNRAEQTGAPAAAMELPDGKIITGKTSDLLGSSAALLLNALKELAGISHETHILSPAAIEPIQILKTSYLGSRNPRLHTDEILIALSSSTALNPAAQKALEQIPNLKGCQVHTSVMLSQVDIQTFKRLGIQLTCEPIYEHKSILHNA